MSKNNGKVMPFSVSQNFLTSRKTIDRLLRLTDLSEADTILEIGAGKGHITKALADTGKQVVTYEIDQKLAEKLAPQLPNNVRLIPNDFLRCPLPKGTYKVFANIPFSRTTEIVRKLTDAENAPQSMWLIMEKGAAKRFCGQPRESRISLQIKPFFDAQIVYHFRREDFHPMPRVDVVMLEFKHKLQPDLPVSQQAAFSAFFEQVHRKGLYKLLTKKQVSTALRLAGLPPIEPSGNMQYVQWLCLFRCWQQFGRKV